MPFNDTLFNKTLINGLKFLYYSEAC